MTIESTSAIEEAIINGGYCEKDDIKESLKSQLQRHINWHEDTIRSCLDREFGQKEANKQYKRIKQEAMNRVARLTKTLSSQISKQASQDSQD